MESIVALGVAHENSYGFNAIPGRHRTPPFDHDGTMTRPRTRLARLHDAAGTDLLNIAHRGARGTAPENTLPAFEKGAALGAHMFELDVHLSADGHVVVHHDDDLLRCTDVAARFPGRASYFVSDFSLAELQTLDAGSWFAKAEPVGVSCAELSHYASGDVRIPTLLAVLELASELGRLVNVELKALPRRYPALAAQTLQCIERLGVRDRVLISSFDHQQLIAVRAMSEHIATAVLSSDRLARVAGYLQLLDADAYHPGCVGGCDSIGFQSLDGRLDAATISELRGAGKHINVWTCNDPHQMTQLMALGVTGIVTDYPERLHALLEPPVSA
jgi:glycerophosphoryl diester phosphodiesterase